MNKREPSTVLILSIVTFGVYVFVWWFATTAEVNRVSYKKVPNPWLSVIPFANIYWLWRYSEAVEALLGESWPVHKIFMLEFLIGPVGSYMLQKEFNSLPAKAIASVEKPVPAVASEPAQATEINNPSTPDATANTEPVVDTSSPTSEGPTSVTDGSTTS